MIIETTEPQMAPSPNQTTEISRMLNKLRTLVPGIPPEQKMSKLEIMQHVIDYISELETVLGDEHQSGQHGPSEQEVESNGSTNSSLQHLQQLVN